MKNFLVIFFLLVSGLVFGQYPVRRTMEMSSKDMVIYKDGPQPDSGRVYLLRVVDTLHVPPLARKIPGLVIWVTSDSTIWVRNDGCNRWFRVMSGVGR